MPMVPRGMSSTLVRIAASTAGSGPRVKIPSRNSRPAGCEAKATVAVRSGWSPEPTRVRRAGGWRQIAAGHLARRPRRLGRRSPYLRIRLLLM